MTYMIHIAMNQHIKPVLNGDFADDATPIIYDED